MNTYAKHGKEKRWNAGKTQALWGLVAACALLGAAPPALGGPTEQAKRIHDRLAGVPPSPAALAQMVSFLKSGNLKSAALLAMDNDAFYTVTLKNWFSTWTNVEGTPYVNLNDFSATAIGLIRDDLSFDQALYGDILYVGADALVSTLNTDGSVAVKRQIMPYQNNSNRHYSDLETVLINPADVNDTTSNLRTRNISLRQFLVRKQQSAVTGVADTAGVLTTRAFGAAFFSAGTNRRALKFTTKNFLCMDIDHLRDTTRSDYHVRRDVDRAPGGDSRTYKQTCVGCHAGMDGLDGAFAYFDFQNNQNAYTAGKVQSKLNKNSGVFPDGWVTKDDSWVNLWAEGQNAFLGWHGAASGKGVRELGRMMAQTDAFSQCMVIRVFKRLCLRDLTADEGALLNRLASDFSASGRYNMKDLFAAVATLPQCMGD